MSGDSPSSPVVAASHANASGVPRKVVYAGKGLPPSVMLVAISVLFAPGLLAPFIVNALLPPGQEPLPADFGLFWGVVAVVLIFFSVGVPLRRKRLLQRGDLVAGRITGVVSKTRGKVTTHSISYTFTPLHAHAPVQASAETTRTLERTPRLDDAIHVVYAPGNVARAMVVEFSDYRTDDSARPGVGAGRLALTLVLLVSAPWWMVASELGGVTVLTPQAGPPFTMLRGLLLMALLGGAVWMFLRRQAQPPPPPGASPLANVMVWNVLLLMTLGITAFTGMFALNRHLPSPVEKRSLVVQAQFCVDVRDVSQHCLLEFSTPPQLGSQSMVYGRLGSEEKPLLENHLGAVLQVDFHHGALGIPYVEEAPFHVNTQGAVEVGGIYLNKRLTMRDAVSQRLVSARGFFAKGSRGLDQLRGLGIPVEVLAPPP